MSFVRMQGTSVDLLDLTTAVLFCGHGLVIIFARSHHAYADESDDHGEREKELFHLS